MLAIYRRLGIWSSFLYETKDSSAPEKSTIVPPCVQVGNEGALGLHDFRHHEYDAGWEAQRMSTSTLHSGGCRGSCGS